jgi:hypothetical protein
VFITAQPADPKEVAVVDVAGEVVTLDIDPFR